MERGLSRAVDVIMLWPRASVSDDELQVDTAAGKGGDAVECRAALEEAEGSPGGRGEGEEGDEQVWAWRRVTESNALPAIPSFYGRQNAPSRKGFFFQRERATQAADSGWGRPSKTFASVS